MPTITRQVLVQTPVTSTVQVQVGEDPTTGNAVFETETITTWTQTVQYQEVDVPSDIQVEQETVFKVGDGADAQYYFDDGDGVFTPETDRLLTEEEAKALLEDEAPMLFSDEDADGAFSGTDVIVEAEAAPNAGPEIEAKDPITAVYEASKAYEAKNGVSAVTGIRTNEDGTFNVRYNNGVTVTFNPDGTIKAETDPVVAADPITAVYEASKAYEAKNGVSAVTGIRTNEDGTYSVRYNNGVTVRFKPDGTIVVEETPGS